MSLFPRALPRRAGAYTVAALLCLIAVCADAQWKWRDKEGRITASDLPPPRDIADKDILVRPAPESRRASASPAASAASAGAPAKTALEREVEARRRAAEQQKAAQASADEARTAAQRATNCQRAREHVAALESGQRIARVNAQGEREVLDDSGRAEELRQAREVITSDCR